LPDQAALFGVLWKIRHLNVCLLALSLDEEVATEAKD
jgi:hypothetical protein